VTASCINLNQMSASFPLAPTPLSPPLYFCPRTYLTQYHSLHRYPSPRLQYYNIQEMNGLGWCTAIQGPPPAPSSSASNTSSAMPGEGSGVVLSDACGSSPFLLLQSFSSRRAPGQGEHSLVVKSLGCWHLPWPADACVLHLFTSFLAANCTAAQLPPEDYIFTCGRANFTIRQVRHAQSRHPLSWLV
jgi:hypothetical protein